MLAGKRHQAAIAEADPALLRRGVALLADGDELVAAHHQPAVAVRIGGLETEHRHRGAVGQRARNSASVSGRTNGVSANTTRISSAPRAIALAPPAPHARCRAVRVCTKICAFGANARASAATASWSGPDHDGDSRRRPLAAASTWASSERPPSACSAFGCANACGCLRRPRARSQGMFVEASVLAHALPDSTHPIAERCHRQKAAHSRTSNQQ